MPAKPRSRLLIQLVGAAVLTLTLIGFFLYAGGFSPAQARTGLVSATEADRAVNGALQASCTENSVTTTTTTILQSAIVSVTNTTTTTTTQPTTSTTTEQTTTTETTTEPTTTTETVTTTEPTTTTETTTETTTTSPGLFAFARAHRRTVQQVVTTTTTTGVPMCSTPADIFQDLGEFRGSGDMTWADVSLVGSIADQAAIYRQRGDCANSNRLYQKFITVIQTYIGRGIDTKAANHLIADAQALIAHCP